MGASAPDPPTPPDPVATASAQAQANAGTATAQAALNNANSYSPQGSVTYRVTGASAYKNPDGSWSQVPTYSKYTHLSPDQQKIYQQNVALAQGQNAIAQNEMTQIGGILAHPMTSASIQPLTQNLNLATTYGSGGSIQKDLAGGGPIQRDLADPNTFNAARDATTNAELQRLQPGMDQQTNTLQAQLINQGITQGSSAWNAAMLQNNQANNDLRLGAVNTGNLEQQALFGEAATAGGFHNAAQGQAFGEGAAAGAFHNSAQSLAEQELAARAGFGNAATTAGATFHNQAVGQDLQQQAALRQMPINEIDALRSGGQVSAPQGSQYAPSTLDQTPISADTYASASLAEQSYMAQAQAAAQENAGLYGMGGAFLGGIGKAIPFSDRRLKRDVELVGKADNGLNVYRWRYTWGDDWHVGYMADEVELVRPDAVSNDNIFPTLKRVDYWRLVA